MTESFNTQVNREHYFSGYDTPERFLNYFYQIDSVVKTHSHRVLEIGVGNHFVADALKRRGLDVTTCDFDASLKPHVVADIRSLSLPDKSFDLITAFEILEHLPFSEVEKALSELARVAKKFVIISLPYTSAYAALQFSFRIPRVRRSFAFALRIPYFLAGIKMNVYNKEHYWELGRKGYSKRRIKKVFSNYFTVQKAFRPAGLNNHFFFVLQPKA